MAYIPLPDHLPGMRGLLAFRPAIAPSLTALTQTLLRSDEGLNPGERELIGAFVSALNDCAICQNVHTAAAQCLLGADDALMQTILDDYSKAGIPAKLKTLLAIAASVQRGGKSVTIEQVETARTAGATDIEIHDTVLIAGLFCLFNRYLDGLGVVSDDTPEAFRERGQALAEHGYAG